MHLLPRPKRGRRPSTFTFRAASRRLLPLVFGLGLALGAQAQLLFENPDWKESEAPPPPKFDVQRMLEVDMPRQRDLRYGVDPDTIRITGDGVVRYVAIAKRPGNQGPVNAFYEGVRCASGEVKTYARYSGDGWRETKDPQWVDLGDQRSTHSLVLAREALCQSAAPRSSVGEMVKLLKNQKPLD